jgi:hypothetical protein
MLSNSLRCTAIVVIPAIWLILSTFTIGVTASEESGGLFSAAVCFEDKGANPNKVDSLHDLASGK